MYEIYFIINVPFKITVLFDVKISLILNVFASVVIGAES